MSASELADKRKRKGCQCWRSEPLLLTLCYSNLYPPTHKFFTITQKDTPLVFTWKVSIWYKILWNWIHSHTAKNALSRIIQHYALQFCCKIYSQKLESLEFTGLFDDSSHTTRKNVEKLKNVISKCTYERDMHYRGSFDAALAILNYIKIEDIYMMYSHLPNQRH